LWLANRNKDSIGNVSADTAELLTKSRVSVQSKAELLEGKVNGLNTENGNEEKEDKSLDNVQKPIVLADYKQIIKGSYRKAAPNAKPPILIEANIESMRALKTKSQLNVSGFTQNKHGTSMLNVVGRKSS